MTSSEASKAFDRQFAFTTPNSFPSIYSAGARTDMANQLSISSNFGLLGPIAACDTETALRRFLSRVASTFASFSFGAKAIPSTSTSRRLMRPTGRNSRKTWSSVTSR